jgi:hypothetical protein
LRKQLTFFTLLFDVCDGLWHSFFSAFCATVPGMEKFFNTAGPSQPADQPGAPPECRVACEKQFGAWKRLHTQMVQASRHQAWIYGVQHLKLLGQSCDWRMFF